MSLTDADREGLICGLVEAQVRATGVTASAFAGPGSDFERMSVRYVDQYGIAPTVERIVARHVAAAKAEAEQTIRALSATIDQLQPAPTLDGDGLTAEQVMADVRDRIAAAKAEAWERGRMAARAYIEAIQRVHHWSYIGTEKPTPPRNPYRADRIGGDA